MDVKHYAYCSQAGALVSNLAFAWGAWTLRRTAPALAWLLVAVFVASTFWHMLPTQTTLLLDWAAAGLVSQAILYRSLRSHLEQSRTSAGLLLAALSALSTVFWWIFPALLPLDGSIILPGVLYLLATGAWLLGRDRALGLRVLLAGACFALGLALRSADLAACPVAPFGLHFFWHVLAAAGTVLMANATMRTAA